MENNNTMSNKQYNKISKIPTYKDKNKRSHSQIFTYEGLNTAVYKYNCQKTDNKSNNNTEKVLIPNKNQKNNVHNDLKNDKNNKIPEKKQYLSKLKKMNNNIDLILTGLKDNLENATNEKEKKIIQIDDFIEFIDSNTDKSLSSENNINNVNIKNGYYKTLNKAFSFLKISNFNFEIINNKKYLIDINKLNEEEKIKIKYIFNNNINSLDLNDIINKIYDFKNKYEEIKNTNKLNLKKDIDENYFKEIIKKKFEFNQIEENNIIIKNETNCLLEGLVKSYYYSDQLLNRYYSLLNKIDNSIQKNIEEIYDDILY